MINDIPIVQRGLRRWGYGRKADRVHIKAVEAALLGTKKPLLSKGFTVGAGCPSFQEYLKKRFSGGLVCVYTNISK